MVMRIQPNGEASPVTRLEDRSAARPPRLGEDKKAFAGADALERALKNTPEVRPERVAEAQKLVLDDNYPPEVLVRKIAALLAIDLGKTDPLDDESDSSH